MKKTILIIGIIFLFIGIYIIPSIAEALNVDISTNFKPHLTSYISSQEFYDINPIQIKSNKIKNIDGKNQPFEKNILKKNHKNINNLIGNSWIIYPTDDTYISKNQPSQNYGSNNYFLVGRDDWFNTNCDALIKFDISSIPSNIKVFAKLYLYYYDYNLNPANREYSIYRITSNWDENTATWINQPSYVSTMTDILIVTESTGIWLEYDVSDDVQSFIDGKTDNYGWIISDMDEYTAQDNYAFFHSKEHAGFIPYLFVKEPDTIYVDDDNIMGPWKGTYEYPYQYIQDGINNSFLGDTVYVFNGTYDESVIIYENRINLIGESKNNTRIINQDKNYVVLIRQRYYGITIRGFTIQTASENPNNYVGIVLDIYTKNINISCNKITDNIVGIYLWSLSKDNHILNNQVFNNTLRGISLNSCRDSTISYNTFDNNYLGLKIISSTNILVSNNIVTYSNSGLYLEGYLEKNIISNNILKNNYYGIYADHKVNDVNITGNTIIKNSIGIDLEIVLYCNISNNIIDNNLCGIFTDESEFCKLINIFKNNISNNSGNFVYNGGIYAYTISNTKLYLNNFMKNSRNVFIQSSNLNVLWDCNYWDDYTGKDNDGNGIGDTPHIVYSKYKDNYPLMEPYGSYSPDAPSAPKINGPHSGTIGVKYNYTFISTDINNDNVFYYITWGDGTFNSWIGPYASGELITLNHVWSKKGTYSVIARVKDSNGLIGPWGTFSITMPRSKTMVSSPLLSLLERNPLLNLLFQRLVKYCNVKDILTIYLLYKS